MFVYIPSLICIPYSISYKCLWYNHYYGYDKHGKFDKMPPKVAILSLVATISGRADTSMAESLDTDSQVVIRGQL